MQGYTGRAPHTDYDLFSPHMEKNCLKAKNLLIYFHICWFKMLSTQGQLYIHTILNRFVCLFTNFNVLSVMLPFKVNYLLNNLGVGYH